MYHSMDVAKYIVYWYVVNHKDITLSRLRLLPYFLQMYWLYFYEKPCFEEELYAWDMGPTEPTMYWYYRKKYDHYCISAERDYGMSLSEGDRKVIANFLAYLDDYSTFQLGNIARNQTPWLKNYCSYDTVLIPLKDMKEFIDTRSK